MKKRLSLVCGLCICLALCAGEIQKVSAVYEYTSNNLNETLAEVEANAFERAKQKALEDKFGLDVNSVSNSLQINRASGNNAQTETNVFSLGGTAVARETISTCASLRPWRAHCASIWWMKIRTLSACFPTLTSNREHRPLRPTKTMSFSTRSSTKTPMNMC